MHTEKMLETNPTKPLLAQEPLMRCIEACFDCAQASTACADACLGEDKLDALRACIRLNHDCADICIATGNVLSRQLHANARVLRAQLEACLAICAACGDECAHHAQHHEHCRVCAEACRTCAKACQSAIAAFSPASTQPMTH